MITEQERNYLLNSMQDLLDEYDYDYTLMALNEIIDEWASQKADLIDAFKKHPNYVEGRFMIAFSKDYERGININSIKEFSNYIESIAPRAKENLPKDIDDQRIADGCHWLPRNLFNFLVGDLSEYINGRTISDETAKYLDEIIPQIHPHAGQKSSRVINKICEYIHYNTDPNYNREFAKLADALSPIVIKRHTVLSINPLDYLTMSFGNSWSSCHTIDKENVRDMPDSYEGMYSSGTMSYMLDKSSMVFYTVDAGYDGSDYWTQPKICRQMFHWGEEKLVQSRLYPQDNDGEHQIYTPYRNIVQEIMALIFDFPNLWKISRGSDAASAYIYSEGTHYRDYTHFSSCSLSRIQGSENEKSFTVGATPICINCGNRHHVQGNINHCAVGTICHGCGRVIEDEDEEYWVDDDCYCEECVTYCSVCEEYHPNEECTYIEREGRYVCNRCLNEYYEYCEDCEEYYDRDDMYHVESTDEWVCRDCLDNYYCCEDCGEYYTRDDVIEGPDGSYYCKDCYEERFSDEEEEEE